MSPSREDFEIFMPRGEIDAKRDAAITTAKSEIRTEMQKELGLLRGEVSGVKSSVEAVQRDVVELKTGQAKQDVKLDGLQTQLTNLATQISNVSSTTTTIVEETKDGRQITKHFRSWGTAYSDVKKFWPHIVAAYLAYKAFGGFMQEHGINWTTIWSTHR